MKKLGVGIFLLLLFEMPLNAQNQPVIIPLWQNGAPGFEDRKNEPEQAKDWWVKNVHNPSLTVFLPTKEKANGAAIVICPGGGHRTLVFDAEGRDAALFFNSLGITAFVLKYRLFREENSPYTEANTRQDALRAMRLVRSRAKEWSIDPTRLGIMGFSAGGELAAWTSFDDGKENPKAKDEVERYPAKPNFQILIYPGPLAVPDSLGASAPPAFLLAANDDECCADPVVQLLTLYRKAKIPVEVHLYTQGNHAFNMGNRSTLHSIKTWSDRLGDWLKDNEWLIKK